MMKKVSRWAVRNPVKSRVIIGLGHVFLALSAVALGVLSYFLDLELPYAGLWIAAGVFAAAFFLYPEKGKQQGLFRYSYARQKSMDFVMLLVYPLVMAIGVNHFAVSPDIAIQREVTAAAPQWVHKVAANSEAKVAGAPEPGKKSSLKELKRAFRTQLKQKKAEYKKNGNGRGWGTAGLIALVVVGMLVLSYLVAALACGLACSGAEGLAVLVFFLGIPAIIGLGIYAIIKIVNRP